MRLTVLVLLALSLTTLPACDLTRFTANSSAALFTRGSTAVEGHWDTELVGSGLPGSIMTLEGVYSVVPDNEPLGISLARAYSSYAFGWIEEGAEIADSEGDIDTADALNGRARLLYERARNIGLHHLRARDAGIDDAIHGGVPEVTAFLEQVKRLPNLELTGLTCMPPLADEPEASRPAFKALAQLARTLSLPRLSMGTTGDFEIAIEEGATHVRVGTALFGDRPGA